jgi:hypothetical protein
MYGLQTIKGGMKRVKRERVKRESSESARGQQARSFSLRETFAGTFVVAALGTTPRALVPYTTTPPSWQGGRSGKLLPAQPARARVIHTSVLREHLCSEGALWVVFGKPGGMRRDCRGLNSVKQFAEACAFSSQLTWDRCVFCRMLMPSKALQAEKENDVFVIHHHTRRRTEFVQLNEFRPFDDNLCWS